ncbi:F0F1 ATP synthase subunit B [Clostridium sp. ZS2-4]|uniref:F0F1 ATP synthase subunit B n=1 Tax=Clostridium sp. ZS2-4 TaxID=2987703 RepID=UPI00227A2184|nr:F0F1 ATP synthase subunit B [Clostridium sp. ZS2-4]MCY6355482.1 F0F1 ATP synthase subunit B [Clostridium sp. ZS2-4]
MEFYWPKVIYTIINFVILYVILKHFLFKPVNELIDSRRNEIATTINKTEEDRKQAELLRIENENIIKEAKKQGKNLVEDYKKKAEKVSIDIIAEARKESDEIMQRTEKEIQRQREKVEDEIRSNTIDLAIRLSSKVLEEAVDEKKHRQLIEDFIAKVGN